MTLKLLIPLPVAALAALLCTPATGAAQSILLSSENFALLGGTGITSTGTVGTVISNGDVGLSPGPTTGITGFPPAVITNGGIIETGPVTGQARLDLMTAQVGLAGMPSDTNMSNIDLGGKTLFSGVYTFDAAAGLTGALTLDAEGQNNAFWVFQIGTSFNTAVNSSVTIINPGTNGGSDYGVFWAAGAEIILGANNDILGNYLSGTSITFGSNSSGSGRALALAAISLDQNAVDVFGGPGGGDWAGGLMYDQGGAVVPVPEPSTYAALFGLAALGFVFVRRLRGNKKA